MQKTYYLDSLRDSKEFRFDRLVMKGIDNAPVKKFYKSEMIDVEYCLFHREVVSGDEYFEILHNFICEKLSVGNAAPVVRFADGEYAFYAYSLKCNGLYQQAESVETIKKAMPIHVKALKLLTQGGKLAPVVFPGNIRHQKKTLFSFFRKKNSDASALKFFEFLHNNNIKLTHNNYIPFFVVYAYLTSKKFSEIVDGKKLCLISSEINMESCRQWFARLSSYPEIVFAKIPDQYVATRWGKITNDVLAQIPSDTDICLVGAGIGSLLVCVDIAHKFSIPAIDAGHVLNMMNGREDKSNGPRLYTIHKDQDG